MGTRRGAKPAVHPARARTGHQLFFDTVDMYSLGVSEEVTGRHCSDFAPRDEVVLATKVFFPIGQGPNGGGLSRKTLWRRLIIPCAAWGWITSISIKFTVGMTIRPLRRRWKRSMTW